MTSNSVDDPRASFMLGILLGVALTCSIGVFLINRLSLTSSCPCCPKVGCEVTHTE